MDRQKVIDRMRKLCSAREYCKSDIRKKIAAIADDEVDGEEIIESLIKDKYLDETRYAKAFVNDKALLQGWGETKIRYALGAKKIDREIIGEALGTLDGEAVLDKMSSVLKNKYRTIKGTEEEKFAKLYRFAAGRGYSYENIKKIYDIIRTDKRD
ncbi:MAG: RecX family transcriptional regulator [Bacteroidales bacterium]|nr:RecX family transcriptional regulator [Bacteroidales bacterium]